MSLWNSVLSNTIGQLWQATGTVDPWTVANDLEDQTAAAIQSLGPGASDAAKVDAANQVTSIYNTQLTAAGANPNGGCWLNVPIIGCVLGPAALPNLKKIVDTTIFVVAAGGVLYFGIKYRQSIKRGIVAAKKDLKL